MIQHYTYDSQVPGKKILFFGRIHGNEPCGEFALRKLLHQIETGSIVLLEGSITVVPICNPEATKLNQRQVDENLNRVFRKTTIPKTYEQKLANILTEYVDNCDILVDLHSGHTENAYFVFQDYDSSACTELAQASNIPMVIIGWPELYKDTGDMDTVSYAFQQGKPGIVIEGGQHLDENSVHRTYDAIVSILKYYNMIEGSVDSVVQQKIVMDSLYYKQKDGRLSKEFMHGDVIRQGEILATYDDGESIVAPRDSVMILPKNYATGINVEWFYLGHGL